jgi:hypothetical protein
MSTTVRYALSGAVLLGSSKVTINTATTTAFDFGTPNDLPLHQLSTYPAGARVLVVLTASTAGTTDALTWVIQDADDSSGSIGTPATATISAIGSSALAASTGDDFSAFAVKIVSGRPWLRVSVTRAGTTDTHVTHCTVWALPSDV